MQIVWPRGGGIIATGCPGEKCHAWVLVGAQKLLGHSSVNMTADAKGWKPRRNSEWSGSPGQLPGKKRHTTSGSVRGILSQHCRGGCGRIIRRERKGCHSRSRRDWWYIDFASPPRLGGLDEMNPVKRAPVTADEVATRAGSDTLTVVDNRTGKKYELPVTNGTIRALDLRQIKVDEHDFGLMSYDPAFNNTALCYSKITYIDGDAGILRYRGYPIEELAEKSTYLETAYLILHGELPNAKQLEEWTYHITHHTFIHESIKKFLDGFHYDAHPMGMMISTIAALSTFYPEAKDIFNEESRRNQTYRMIGKMPTLAAFAYRHSLGMPFAYPDNDLSYAGNFLNMLFKTTELKYHPNPTLERALDILFILHADHEQN